MSILCSPILLCKSFVVLLSIKDNNCKMGLIIDGTVLSLPMVAHFKVDLCVTNQLALLHSSIIHNLKRISFLFVFKKQTF